MKQLPHGLQPGGATASVSPGPGRRRHGPPSRRSARGTGRSGIALHSCAYFELHRHRPQVVAENPIPPAQIPQPVSPGPATRTARTGHAPDAKTCWHHGPLPTALFHVELSTDDFHSRPGGGDLCAAADLWRVLPLGGCATEVAAHPRCADRHGGGGGAVQRLVGGADVPVAIGPAGVARQRCRARQPRALCAAAGLSVRRIAGSGGQPHQPHRPAGPGRTHQPFGPARPGRGALSSARGGRRRAG